MKPTIRKPSGRKAALNIENPLLISRQAERARPVAGTRRGRAHKIRAGAGLAQNRAGAVTGRSRDKQAGRRTVYGQFYTRKMSWFSAPVRQFFENHIKTNKYVLDPFAGEGDLLKNLSKRYKIICQGYDLSGNRWPVNDSLIHIPNPRSALILTNPPYLAKHSAKRKAVFSKVRRYYTAHYDLYEAAIARGVEAAKAAVFIIPETFLHSAFPKHQLKAVSVIIENPFTTTENPVCVACFESKRRDGETNAEIYIGDQYICLMSDLRRHKRMSEKIECGRSGLGGGKPSHGKPRAQNEGRGGLGGGRVEDAKINPSGPDATTNGACGRRIAFNDPSGKIALKAVDGVRPEDRIRFEKADNFYYGREKIKNSSRMLTYVSVPGLSDGEIGPFLKILNRKLEEARAETADLLLSPFKGNNKAGRRRRRLDYTLARRLIEHSLNF